MATECSDPKNNIYPMTWEEVHERGCRATPTSGRPYGVPRGGTIVAAMCKEMPVEDPSEADFFVDDIIDSGLTRARYAEEFPGTPFYALVNKQDSQQDAALPWVHFPWDDEEGVRGPTDAVVRILEYIGEDPLRDGLQRTPQRVLKALDEMCAGYTQDPREILSTVFDIDTKEMVILHGIHFTSLCEHHILPFAGEVSVGYLPNEKVVGLSKLARVVQTFAKRLQVQERMTSQIANAIEDALKPQGVGVVVRAHHQCMGCRGVRQPEAEMVTSCMLGAMRTTAQVRAEFLSLVS